MNQLYFMGCGCAPDVVFALWTFSDGLQVGVCQPHLDMCLDAADDNPKAEPASLKFLADAKFFAEARRAG
jgi:hypothetical protein